VDVKAGPKNGIAFFLNIMIPVISNFPRTRGSPLVLVPIRVIRGLAGFYLRLQEFLGHFYSMLAVGSHAAEPLLQTGNQNIELLMIQPQQGQHGRMEVTGVHLILNGMEPDFVRGADDFAPFDSASRQPSRKSIGIVISSFLAL